MAGAKLKMGEGEQLKAKTGSCRTLLTQSFSVSGHAGEGKGPLIKKTGKRGRPSRKQTGEKRVIKKKEGSGNCSPNMERSSEGAQCFCRGSLVGKLEGKIHKFKDPGTGGDNEGRPLLFGSRVRLKVGRVKNRGT